ncbi:ABC transporter substrate-binding protein [Robbsia sp. KACC 23696]|uniref:MlaC/ttg2D family ABC transporter substrate-binding protein n=1 Tax=Robbsia sp. KACC 23696 TaxID=3149231 RepID=UPI00325C234E
MAASAQTPASAAVSASAQPDALIKQVTGDVMTAVKTDPALQSGDVNHIITLVNQKILPYTDFQRTTRLVMGRYWRQASAQQRDQVVEQFKLLLIRTYSGAIAQVRNQQIEYLPFRADPGATDVVVRTRVTNQGQPIELDYRLGKTANGWKVYDLNVLGAWLIQAYQQQFAEQVQQHGVDGLIQFLTARNQQLAQAKG